MPTKKPRKKTKAELNEEIGELLLVASVRADHLAMTGNKAHKEQAKKLSAEVKRAHRAFKEACAGRKR